MSDLRKRVLDLVEARGLDRRKEPFQLSSGEWSNDYIDGKRAIRDGAALQLVAEACLEICREKDIQFEAVGGLTMGADPLAHAISMISGAMWFSVRKEAKKHGKQKLIEGCELTPGMKVLLVDDVVTTGRSIIQALEALLTLEADVVLAITLVDRGKVATDDLSARGVAYAPLLTFEDLGIDPVGSR